MAAVNVSSAFLANPVQVGPTYGTDAGNKFIECTVELARRLVRATEESQIQGSDTPFTVAYQQYAGEQPRIQGVNVGGNRAQVLTNIIRSLYSAQAPINIPVADLVNLGSTLNVTGNFRNSARAFKSVPVRLTLPAGVLATISGSSSAEISAINPGAAAAQVTMTFGLTASFVTLTSATPFQLSPVGVAPPAARQSYFVSPMTGAQALVIPAGATILLTVNGYTRIRAPISMDMTLVEAGFQRALVDGLFFNNNVRLYDSFDEMMIAQADIGQGGVPIVVSLGFALQAYELTRRALPL
ncbi:VP9 [Banna-like virus strain Balaton/2010/HUN]|nr:VP9 [Banna-like virus strain Balaton/2010/HUN]